MQATRYERERKPSMNYELYMRAALAEAAQAAAAGERADGAVAVLDEAMVAHGRAAIIETGDPTAHATLTAVRSAASRLRRTSLAGMTVFSVLEPCAMCTGALLQADADGVVFALPDANAGACAAVVRLAEQQAVPRRLQVVSGILQEAAEELRPDLRERTGSA
jgi:tRNA(adenine34) deaminase